MKPLQRLVAGQELVVGGDRVLTVSDELARSYRPGDLVIPVASTARIVHVPATERAIVDDAVASAARGFTELAACDDDQITAFFDRFADRLLDDEVFTPIASANTADVERARARGRSVTRLILDERMRGGMAGGLRGWRDAPLRRDETITTHAHASWSVEARRAPLGVVGFVFEGRPNVFADACGVVRTGNAVVFRIGSDALGTARSIVEHALRPALADAGLPPGTVQLVGSEARAAGHALFSDTRLSLAVARGSGPAVAELGAVATQAGIPVSLHGTGGAWVVAGETADHERLRSVVHRSLDRKVCNTLNVCAIPASSAERLVPSMLAGLDAAAVARGVDARLHVVSGAERFVPADRFARRIKVARADGTHDEPAASSLDEDRLAHEWEWEENPEMTLVVTESVDHSIELCNRYSPRFVASIISEDGAEHDRFYAAVDAPFVGDGFTRWVDGQYALETPELGLSNWERGRMLGRGAILSGDSVFTVRYSARIDDGDLHR